MRIKKIWVIPFACMLSCVHALVGFILGAVVSLQALTTTPSEMGPAGFGVWSILLFPLLNAAIGFMGGVFLAGFYNIYADNFKGIVLDVDNI